LALHRHREAIDRVIPMDQFIAWLVKNDVGLAKVSATLALLVATAVGATALNRLLRRLIGRIGSRLPVPYESLLTTTRFVTGCLWLIAVLLVLEVWGIGFGGVWTFLASAIAVIGVGFLAVWTIVSNATAGVFITFWRPFQLGQTVEVLPEALKGRVIDRNMMYTVLREEGGSLLHVPNNLFFQRLFRVTDTGGQSLFESFESERRGATNSP
jgi:small-conductance mechanosensitive channel